MAKHLYRPGVALAGDWTPNCPEYPFHFTEPKVGDRVWVILIDSDTEELSIEPDTIEYVSDFYLESKHQKESGAPAYQDKELLAPETYLIDFWLEKHNPGHGVDFGSEIYRSFDEAAFVLLQMYTHNYEDYTQCLAEIKRLRRECRIKEFFD